MRTNYFFRIISLKDSSDRWASVSNEFKRLALTPIKFEAVDGRNKNFKIPYITEISDNITLPQKNYNKMTSGEIACFLSHRKCWEDFIKSDFEWALIGEDDIFLSSKGKELLISPDWIPSGVDLVQIGSFQKESLKCYVERKSLIKLKNNFSLVKMLKPSSMGTQLYWMNKKAARIALELSHCIHEPVDHFLFEQNNSYCQTIGVYTLTPFICYQDFNAPSILTSKGRKLIDPLNKKNESFYIKLLKHLKSRYLKIKSKKIIRQYVDQK